MGYEPLTEEGLKALRAVEMLDYQAMQRQHERDEARAEVARLRDEARTEAGRLQAQLRALLGEPVPECEWEAMKRNLRDARAEVERLRADAADMAGQWLCCWTHPDLILTGDEIERRAEIVQAWCAHRGIAVGEVTAPARDEVIASLQAEVERLRADARLQAENLRIARRSGDEARAQAAALRAARPDEELLERARVAVEQYLPLSGIYCAHPPSVEPADPAPGTREWAASAPLDEVRAWLDGRGVIDHRPAHMTDMYSRLVLVADGRTIASVSVTGTNAAALRALAAQVAQKEADGRE